jgi:hypothetical protein
MIGVLYFFLRYTDNSEKQCNSSFERDCFSCHHTTSVIVGILKREFEIRNFKTLADTIEALMNLLTDEPEIIFGNPGTIA